MTTDELLNLLPDPHIFRRNPPHPDLPQTWKITIEIAPNFSKIFVEDSLYDVALKTFEYCKEHDLLPKPL